MFKEHWNCFSMAAQQGNRAEARLSVDALVLHLSLVSVSLIQFLLLKERDITAPQPYLGGNGSGRLPVVPCDQDHVHTHAFQCVHCQGRLWLDSICDGDHPAKHTWSKPHAVSKGAGLHTRREDLQQFPSCKVTRKQNTKAWNVL